MRTANGFRLVKCALCPYVIKDGGPDPARGVADVDGLLREGQEPSIHESRRDDRRLIVIGVVRVQQVTARTVVDLNRCVCWQASAYHRRGNGSHHATGVDNRGDGYRSPAIDSYVQGADRRSGNRNVV